MTLWPAATYSRAAPGVRPTRYSCTLISFGTPTRIAGTPFSSLICRSDFGLSPCNFGGYCDFMPETGRNPAIRAGIQTNETRADRSFRHDDSVGTRDQRPGQPGRPCRARRAFEHGHRAAAESAGRGRLHSRLSGRAGFDALWPLYHRAGQGHAGKPERGCAEIVRSRGHRVSIGGALLPDVRQRRLHRHRDGARHRGLRAHSPNRAVAIATGCADPVELRHARGRQPGGPAGDLRRTAPARTDVTAPGIATVWADGRSKAISF